MLMILRCARPPIRAVPSETEFLRRANGRCRTRTFGRRDYRAFLAALAEADAVRCRRNGTQYISTQNAGGVARAYRYYTETAQWYVYLSPDDHITVHHWVGRVPAVGRVPCAYFGGERAYRRDWERRARLARGIRADR